MIIYYTSNHYMLSYFVILTLLKCNSSFAEKDRNYNGNCSWFVCLSRLYVCWAKTDKPLSAYWCDCVWWTVEVIRLCWLLTLTLILRAKLVWQYAALCCYPDSLIVHCYTDLLATVTGGYWLHNSIADFNYWVTVKLNSHVCFIFG